MPKADLRIFSEFVLLHFKSVVKLVRSSKMNDEIFDIFYIPVKILTTFGSWISKDSSIAYKIYGIVMHLIFLEIYGSFMAMHLTQVHGIDDYAQLMSLLPVYFSCALKTANFMLGIDEVEEVFVMIRECAKELTITREFRARLKQAHQFYKIFWTGSSCIVLLIFMLAVSKQTLSIKMWIPFEINTAFRFWAVAIVQNLDFFGYIGKIFFCIFLLNNRIKIYSN